MASEVAPPRRLPIERRSIAAGLLLTSAGVVIESVAFLAMVFHSPDEMTTVSAAAWVPLGVAHLMIALAVLGGMTFLPEGRLGRVLPWVPPALLALVGALHMVNGLVPAAPWLELPLLVWYMGGSYVLFGVVSLLARWGRWPHPVAVTMSVGFAALALDGYLAEAMISGTVFDTADSALWAQPIRGLILIAIGLVVVAIAVRRRSVEVNGSETPVPRSTWLGLIGPLLGLGLANTLLTITTLLNGSM